MAAAAAGETPSALLPCHTSPAKHTLLPAVAPVAAGPSIPQGRSAHPLRFMHVATHAVHTSPNANISPPAAMLLPLLLTPCACGGTPRTLRACGHLQMHLRPTRRLSHGAIMHQWGGCCRGSSPTPQYALSLVGCTQTWLEGVTLANLGLGRCAPLPGTLRFGCQLLTCAAQARLQGCLLDTTQTDTHAHAVNPGSRCRHPGHTTCRPLRLSTSPRCCHPHPLVRSRPRHSFHHSPPGHSHPHSHPAEPLPEGSQPAPSACSWGRAQ
jgi:hypothetical protein